MIRLFALVHFVQILLQVSYSVWHHLRLLRMKLHCMNRSGSFHLTLVDIENYISLMDGISRIDVEEIDKRF